MLSGFPLQTFHFYSLRSRHIKKNYKNSKRGRGQRCHETCAYYSPCFVIIQRSIYLRRYWLYYLRNPLFGLQLYIGQTKRGLKSRLAEHKRATLNQKPEQSALCVHAMEFEHNIDWINAKILKVENNYSKRLVSEAWFINSRPNVMNRSDGDKLPQVYHILFW